MKTYRYASESLLDAPLEVVFEFFSNAENLGRLSPASLQFEILTPLPISMKTGVLIDYRLKVRGVPLRWRTEITVWDPMKRFVDRQMSGPYRKWVHEHRFQAEGNRTRMWDSVEYALPGGFLAPLFHFAFVRREVERIFEFRDRAIREWLGK